MSPRAYGCKSAGWPLCHPFTLFTSCSLCSAGHPDLLGSCTKWGSAAAGNLILNYFIRLAMKLKLKHCFSNICLQHEFYLNLISALLGVFKIVSQVVRFPDDLIHHRGAKHSWRINMRSVMRGKDFMMDGVPSCVWKAAALAQARVRALWLTWRLVQLWACWALFNKWVSRREQRQRWPLWNPSTYSTAWSRGKSLRFNVGWQWVDISLTVTKCWAPLCFFVRGQVKSRPDLYLCEGQS